MLLGLSFVTIAKHSKTLSPARIILVEKIVFAYCFISLVIFVPLATIPVTVPIISIVLFVITLVTGVVFVVGGWKLRRIIRITTGSTNLLNVSNRLSVAVRVLGFLLLLISCFGAYAGIGPDRDDTYEPPIFPLPRDVCYRLSVLLTEFCQVIVAWYLFPWKKFKLNSTQQTAVVRAENGGISDENEEKAKSKESKEIVPGSIY